MAFRKDPIEVGLLLEAVGSGKDYEVIAEGEQAEHWTVRQIGGKGKGMERATVDLNDPFKWTRINLTELTPEKQAMTILGKREAAPPAADDDAGEDAPAGADAGPPPWRSIEASGLWPGLEMLDEDGEWITVKARKGEQGGWVVVGTSAGDRRVSFFHRQIVRGTPA